MHALQSIYGGLLRLWIRIGIHVFPPTIHPMLVHFPIVLLYGSALTGVIGIVWRTRDRFFDRSSFWLLVLGLIAGIVASAAGVISEQYVKWTPATSALLSTHQAYAILTGLFAILALASRLIARYPRGAVSQGWSLGSRGRQTALSLLFTVAAVVMVTMGASVGGTMVYQYGVGVHGLLYHIPASLTHHS